MFLNCDIPHFYPLLRKEFLYDLRKGHGEFVECMVFRVTSIPPYALLFDVLTDFGGLFARLPVIAFCHKEDAPRQRLDDLQMWGCFSRDISCQESLILKDLKCATILKDRKWYEGRYMMTFDWTLSQIADSPGEGGYKTAHMIALDNGNYALQPNHRMRWWEPAFITKPFPERPDFITNSHEWRCETKDKWSTDDTDDFYYDFTSLEPPQS